MTETSISVIIPVFNTEKYIAQAIESVLMQTLKPAEIIVVDDGSTDRSVGVAQKFEPHVRFTRQENKGAGAARNRGIKDASEEWLAFLDADDFWTATKLSSQMTFLAENPQTDMVFGMVEQFVSPELSGEHHQKLKKELKTMPGYVAGAMLIKKETFLNVGFFSEKLELGEFIDWFSRAKDLGLTHHVLDETVLKRRIHTSNMGIYKKQHFTVYTTLLRDAIARKRNLKQG